MSDLDLVTKVAPSNLNNDKKTKVNELSMTGKRLNTIRDACFGRRHCIHCNLITPQNVITSKLDSRQTDRSNFLY